MIARLALAAALAFMSACASMVAEEEAPQQAAEAEGERPTPAPPRSTPPAKVATAPPTTVPPKSEIAPPVPQISRTNELEMLLTEFERLRRLSAPDVAREHEAARLAFNNSRSDSARMRFAMTMAVPGTPGNDELRALDLLDPLVKNIASPLRGLAVLMSAYLQEQRRLASQVQGLQQNAQGLQQNVQALEKKLDALRSLERSLSEREAAGRRR